MCLVKVKVLSDDSVVGSGSASEDEHLLPFFITSPVQPAHTHTHTLHTISEFLKWAWS